MVEGVLSRTSIQPPLPPQPRVFKKTKMINEFFVILNSFDSTLTGYDFKVF